MNTAKRRAVSRRVLVVTGVVMLAMAGLAIAASRPTTNIHLGKTSFGPYVAQRLQNGHHYPLYMSTHDPRDKSLCFAACLTTFTPVTARGRVIAWNGVKRKLLGIINRGHGVKQVTYNHHPLYTANNDFPGSAYMDGCVGKYGGDWYVLGINGNPDKHFNNSYQCIGY